MSAKFTLVSLGLIFVWIALAIRFGSAFWDGKTSRLAQKLFETAAQGGLKRVSFKDLDLLPAPVARYFRETLKEGQPLIRSARITQAGEFRAREAEDGWSPFKAEQYVSALPRGFVWDARIRMAPFMDVRVRDAYAKGQASMQGKILSLAPLIDERGKAELNAGALQRYLAEAVWYPTALLPGEGVEWSALDNDRALATLTDSGTTVSLEFRFNDAGEITGVFTPGRYREVNGKYELTPWEGHFSHYEFRDGMRVPVQGDVEWQLPSGKFPYWKGRVVSVEYDFAC